MNKKLIIISVLTFITILLIGGGIYYFADQPNPKSSMITSKTKVTGTTNADYSVEKGLEGLAKVTKSAVENYLNQDISEPAVSRNRRLSGYFTSDSPVYGYGQQNITSSVNKSTAKVKSINSCEEQEGGDQCLLVATDTTFYSNSKTNTTAQTYWITLKQQNDGSQIPFDIGEF